MCERLQLTHDSLRPALGATPCEVVAARVAADFARRDPGTGHRWGGVNQLLELATQVTYLPAEKWLGVWELALEIRCTRRVSVSVAHVCRVMSLEQPWLGDAAASTSRESSALLRALTPDGLQPGHDPGLGDHLSNLMWSAATEDTLQGFIHHGVVRAGRPATEDWGEGGAPPRAPWFYLIRRPVRLLVSWIARRREVANDGAPPSGGSLAASKEPYADW